jgi:hypothetical protein
MNARLCSGLWQHVASGPNSDDVERFRRHGWLDAEPQHFSLPVNDPRLTALEFDWLQRIGNRLWGERGK